MNFSTRSWFFRLPLLVGIGALCFGAACSFPVYVDASNTSGVEDGTKSHPYDTIQEAIDGSTGAATIQIAPGIYLGLTLVSRSGVKLSGDPTTLPLIDGTAASAPVVTIDASTGVELSNLVIRTQTKDAVVIDQASAVTLRAVTVEGPLTPPTSGPRLVVVGAACSLVVDGSTLRFGSVGIDSREPGATVTLQNGTRVESNHHGYEGQGQVSLDVRASHFSENFVGISAFFDPVHVTIDATSTIENSQYVGLIAGEGGEAILNGTTIAGNSEGLIAQDAGSHVLAIGARISGQQFGAAATFGGLLEVDHCEVFGSSGGLSAQDAGSTLVLRNGTLVHDTSLGVVVGPGTTGVIDGSFVQSNLAVGVISFGSLANLTVRNGSVISGNLGAGIEVYSHGSAVISNSTIDDNTGDGVWCSDSGTCEVGNGDGLGNTITNHTLAGTFGIRCSSNGPFPNAGVAYCAAGENIFSNNATNIDPACAATCPF